MKLLRFFSTTLIFLITVFAVIRCNDSNITNTSTESVQMDSPQTEQVNLYIYEYVLVSPPDGSPYYEWRPIANYSCYHNPNYPDHCFSDMKDTTFNTPPSSRSESGNTVTTQYFKFEYSSKVNCRPSGEDIYGAGSYWVPTFNIEAGSTTYLDIHHSISGGIECERKNVYDPPIYEDWFVDDLSNVSLPPSSTINVAYGVDLITN